MGDQFAEKEDEEEDVSLNIHPYLVLKCKIPNICNSHIT
jgi:hypothetical protein